VNKYIDIEKRLYLSEYKRNKDKKKIKRITNDLYEEYEDKISPIDKIPPQDKIQPVITDDNFENKLKNIIDDNTEDNKDDNKDNIKNKSDNQQLILVHHLN
jgi:hypothetical protein